MDTAKLITQYSSGDFALSIRQLLPQGSYWQEVDNPELSSVIDAMAIDFKATHDDIEISLLGSADYQLFGWRLPDYQGLLDGIVGPNGGCVSDKPSTPNLICASLNDEVRAYSAKAWEEFETKRLPHTDIEWRFNSRVNYYHQLASYRHIRNQHSYEVTQ